MSWPWNRGQRSLKVIGTDKDRSATYDFLLTFHTNHWPISHRFRNKRRFQSKTPSFSYTVYFAPPLTGFPLELSIGARGQKTRVMGLSGRTWRLTIFCHMDTMHQCDRRTDGLTPDHSKDRGDPHSVAWVKMLYGHTLIVRYVLMFDIDCVCVFFFFFSRIILLHCCCKQRDITVFMNALLQLMSDMSIQFQNRLHV